jgi:membrane associated rhomboid family serine protease
MTIDFTAAPHDPAVPTRERLFSVAPVTLALVLLVIAVHLVRLFVLSDVQDLDLVMSLSFIPAKLLLTGTTSFEPWINLLSYALLHFGWMHLIVNVTGLLAFGTALERFLGWRVYLGILLTGIIAGALFHFIFFSSDSVILGGISAGLSALFAVILGCLQRASWRVLLPGIIAWLAINLLTGLMGVPGQPGLAMAWLAHMGGFFAGLAFLPFLFPAYRSSFSKGAGQ